MSLQVHASLNPEKSAYINATSGQQMSFAELDTASARLARILRSRLVEGDRVAILLGNRADYAVAIWAARRAALRYVPVNWHLRPEEAAYIVENSDARALISAPDQADLANSIVQYAPSVEMRLSTGVAFDDFTAMDAIEQAGAYGPEMEGIYMFYSSGTTGAPKGILRPLPQRPFGTRLPIEDMMDSLYGFESDSVFFTPAPLYHGAPIGWTIGAQMLGGTAILPERFDAEATLAAIERYRVTHAQFVPTHFIRMLKLPSAVRGKYDLSSLKMVVHAAAPCPPEVKRAMMDWWGPIIHEYYSASEGVGTTKVGPQEWLERPGTVGRAVKGIPHVLDDEGNEASVGQVGHLYFEGADPFEYHKDSQKTAQFFNEKGWGCVGDLASMDADGFLYLAGRSSGLIISGGVNIYPQEIENALALHPAVLDIAVVGMPDPEMGDKVVALVQPSAGAAIGPALSDELLAFCRSKLSSFKCPREIRFVEALPRLPNGKLLKRYT